jgi:hypothetical protein
MDLPDDAILATTPEQTLLTAKMAKNLGAKRLLLLFPKATKEAKEFAEQIGKGLDLEIAVGVLVRNQQEAQVALQHASFIVGVATRDLVEARGVNVLTGAEVLEEKDKTHRRGSGLNQVIADLLAQKEKLYAFDLSLVLEAKDRSVVLGRMSQNRRILGKSGVETVLWSFAKDPYGVRAKRERELFLRIL